MSLRTQAKVLRVLQEGEVERIGSQKTIEVDVRVIAATNKNLEEEIARDAFPRGPVLPAVGGPDRGAGAARAARGHRPARRALRAPVPAGEQRARARLQHGGGGRARAPLLARQRPRAQERRRAAADHGGGRRGRARAPQGRAAPHRRGARGRPRPPRRSATSRSAPSGPSWSRSCARAAGTSPPPPTPSARPARTSTRSSRPTGSARRRTARGRLPGRFDSEPTPIDRGRHLNRGVACRCWT